MSQPVTAPAGRGLVDQLKSFLGLGPKEKKPRKIAIEYAPLVVRGSPNVIWMFGSSGAGGTTVLQDIAGYYGDRGRRIILIDFGATPRKQWAGFFPIPDEGWQNDIFAGLGEGNLVLSTACIRRSDGMVTREVRRLTDCLMDEDLSNTLILIDRHHPSVLVECGPLIEKIRRTEGAKIILNAHGGANPELINSHTDGRIWMRCNVHAEDKTTGIGAAWAQESELFKLYVAKSRIIPGHLTEGEAIVSLKNMAHKVTFPKRPRSFP